MNKTKMFTEGMIAPCGLDCSICGQALKSENPCPGCLGPDENKPDFCRERCTIITCEKLKANSYRFCDECPDFPCDACTERETRYMSKYPVRESPAANIADIRKLGMDEFLIRQRDKWTCKLCGEIICVHTGICRGCGKEYRAADMEHELQAQ